MSLYPTIEVRRLLYSCARPAVRRPRAWSLRGGGRFCWVISWALARCLASRNRKTKILWYSTGRYCKLSTAETLRWSLLVTVTTRLNWFDNWPGWGLHALRWKGNFSSWYHTADRFSTDLFFWKNFPRKEDPQKLCQIYFFLLLGYSVLQKRHISKYEHCRPAKFFQGLILAALMQLSFSATAATEVGEVKFSRGYVFFLGIFFGL